MTATCSRPSCGAAADDAETALSLRWQHPREGYWICPACDALDGAAGWVARITGQGSVDDDGAPDCAEAGAA